MPRRLEPETTFDDLEDEVLFTTAALAADPDAADLATMTSTWLSQIAAARAQSLAVRQEAAKADARRIVANARLDVACTTFGDALLAAVAKDRTSARWRTFFAEPVSSFVKQALATQVRTVRGWLALPADAALEPLRPTLTTWADAADAAQTQTASVGASRGQVWQAREALAEALTRERDGLHSALGQRARDRNLARDWPDLFVLVRRARAERAELDPVPG
jgi:hypothetical protein